MKVGYEFECPTLVPGEWVRLSDEELDVAQRLIDLNRTRWWNPSFVGRALRARALPLAFYGIGWNLIDVEARTVDGFGACTFLVGEDEFIAMSGDASPIHDLNKRLALSIDDDAEQGSAYLKFYTSIAWGEFGPFRIIETSDEASDWLSTDVSCAVEKMSQIIHDKGNSWHVNLIYGDELFSAQFGIQSTGRVIMIEDQSKTTGQRRLIFRRPLRVVPFHMPKAP